MKNYYFKSSSKNQKGFTLVEILVVVAIIGILAAVALPSYRSFLVRAKMEDALLVLDSVRPRVEEYYDVNGTLPQNDGDISSLTVPIPNHINIVTPLYTFFLHFK